MYNWLYKIKYSDRDEYESKYRERLKGEATYNYNFKIHSFPAFVVGNTQILGLVSEILMLNKSLFDIQQKLPKEAIDWYKRKCLIEEVKQTNELEGVASTRKEINDILENKVKGNSRLLGIVNKYALLLTDNDIKLSTCKDVRNIYDELVLQEVRTNDAENIPDGVIFRKNDVYVKDKSTGQVIHKGVSPEDNIINDMTELLSLINSTEVIPLVKIAVAHYIFGYIHPFYDGNGRMSRFISSYLISKQLDPIVSFRIAYSIKKDTSKYYKMFKLTNAEENRGELTGFVIYFLELVKNTIKELIEIFEDSVSLLDENEKRVSQMPYDAVTKDILFYLIQNRLFAIYGFTVDDLCELSKKGSTMVRNSLKMLDADGLLLIEKGRPYRYRAK